MDEIIVELNHAYCISDKSVKDLESGKIKFVTKDGINTIPSYFGRGGSVFHCTFKACQDKNP